MAAGAGGKGIEYHIIFRDCAAVLLLNRAQQSAVLSHVLRGNLPITAAASGP